MKNRSFLRNMLQVAAGQGISLLSGVAVGLLLPKALELTDYGYLKIYTLYVAYTALLHFGFADGILLRLAGMDYGSLDKHRLRTWTRFFVAMQAVIGAALLLGSLLTRDPEYRFIITMLGINLVLINLTTYYQFISQATQRFAEYSFKNMVVAALKLCFVLVMLGLYLQGRPVSYRIYVVGLNLIDGLILLWYMFTYRGITFGAGTPLRECLRDIADIFRQGILLTVAYQASHLVLALDRQFVSMLFSTEVYGLYSFAYNIITLISTMISALAIVLLPTLRRLSPEEAGNRFLPLLRTVAMLVGLCAACYFPLKEFLIWFLPDYAGSVAYLRIILPALMYHSGISVVMFTFCKSIGENKAFFRLSLIALATGLVTNTGAQLLFGTPEAISYASLVTMAVWYLLSALCVGRRLKKNAAKEFTYLTVLGALFLLASAPKAAWWIGLLLYTVAFLAVTGLFYGKLLLRRGTRQ